MTPPLTREQKLGILRDALSEAQATVRSYDTKAQIIGVGYVFTLGIVGRLGKIPPDREAFGVFLVIVSWGVVSLPILLFGYVLHPTRMTAPRVGGTEATLLHAL